MSRHYENSSAYSFLAPFLVVYALFTLFPLVQAFSMSLQKVDLLSLESSFLGFKNFRDIFFNDRAFWTSLGNTLKFVLFSTPSILILGLLFALGVHRSDAGIVRTLLFSPYVLSVAVVTLLWGFLLNPQQGLLAAFMQWLGFPAISWLTNPKLALHAIVITTLWWTVGFNMVLFIAGLQDIDPHLYEAARIDGASPVKSFFYITIPGLARTIFLATTLQIIASFQIFGQVYIMTRGGPAGTTRVLIQHIYESGFRDFRLGYASALSVILFILMFAVSMLQFHFARQRDAA